MNIYEAKREAEFMAAIPMDGDEAEHAAVAEIANAIIFFMEEHDMAEPSQWHLSALAYLLGKKQDPNVAEAIRKAGR